MVSATSFVRVGTAAPAEGEVSSTVGAPEAAGIARPARRATADSGGTVMVSLPSWPAPAAAAEP